MSFLVVVTRVTNQLSCVTDHSVFILEMSASG